MAEDDTLAAYRRKRDAAATPEPTGGRPGRGDPRFVVHKHDASSLHYDVRLEVDDVLVSWAVPKGPSLDPREKRLAARTEDHPLDYVDFEGTIPAEEYGGGTVVVWDTGRYRNLTTDDDGAEVPAADALERGHLKVWLDGEKLTGGFALTHARLGGDERNWLLVKVDDDGADRRRNPTSTQPESVLSGRTNADLEDDEG